MKRNFCKLSYLCILLTAAIIVVIAMSGGSTYAQDRPYHEVKNWAKLPAGRVWGHAIGVGVDSHNNVWVFDRCGGLNCIGSNLAPILEFDPSGKLVKSFGAGMFLFPTGLFVDQNDNDNVWVTERSGKGGKGYQVTKFSPEGKVLMTLGKAGVSREGPDTFIGPENVVVAPNGDIFVADAHGQEPHDRSAQETLVGHSLVVPPSGFGERVVKFSKDGKFIKAWGKEGSAPGEFRSIRGMAMDSQGRLFVGDRGNNRMQIFDQDGKFLKEWKQFSQPSGIFFDAKDTIYVADGTSNDLFANPDPKLGMGIRIGNAKDGVVKAFIPPSGPEEKLTGLPLGVAVDAMGSVYEVEGHMKNLRKYVKN